jgi:putative spermidine/putrescine transport system substrate-binding protein
MNRKTLLFVLSLLVVSALLASCGPAAAPAPAAVAPDSGVAKGYNGTAVSSVPADLVAACKQEGMLTIIATPPNWANYGEIFATSRPPRVSSSTHWIPMQAQPMNSPRSLPTRAIRVLRLPISWMSAMHMAQGVTAGDYQPYKGTYWSKLPATTLGIPTADPNGMWTIGYYGIMVIETNTAVVKNPPKNWSDLLKPEYKGQVALAGDPQSSNQAIHGCLCSRTGEWWFFG